MKVTITAALVAGAALLGEVKATGSSGKSCESYKIPLTVSSTDYVFALPPFANNDEVAAFVAAATSRSAPPGEALFPTTVNRTSDFTIGATFCRPGKSQPQTHKDTVIIATHGLNFDRR
jgi:hypothetical protein